ncbi:MAG: lysylphosphatidylglycerol synthase domain-containing protein [Bacteroidota bacterium]
MNNRSNVTTFILRAAPLLTGALLLLFVLRNIDLAETAGLLSDVGMIAPFLLSFYFIGSLCDTIAWRIILRSSTDTVPFIRLLMIHLAGESFYRFLPAGVVVGESVKVVLVKRYSSLATSEIVSSLLLRKVFMGIAQSLYIGLAVLAGIILFGSGMSSTMTAAGLTVSISLLLLFGTMGYFLSQGRLGSVLFLLLQRIPIPVLGQFLAAHKESFIETDRVIKGSITHRKKEGSIACLFFFFGWGTEMLETWAILSALHASVAFGSIMLYEPIVSLLRSVAFVIPGGIGVMDAGYSAAFQGMNAVSAGTVIVAFIVIKRAKELFWVIVGVVLAAVQGAHEETHTQSGRSTPLSEPATIA